MIFKKLLKGSLTKQVLIPTIVVLIVMFSILVVISSNKAKELVYQAETASALERTKEIFEVITQLYEQTMILADLATDNYYIQQGFSQNNNKLFDHYINTHIKLEEFYETIFIMDNKGKIVGHSIKDRIGVDGTHYSFWKPLAINNNKNYIDKIPFTSPVTGNTIQFAASRITDTDGNFLGVVVYVLDLQKFAEIFINHYTIANRGYFYIIDSETNFITHPRKELIMNDDFKDFDFNWQAVRSREEFGVINYVFEGDDKTISYGKLEMLDWVICASMYDEDLANVGSVIANIIIWISIISIILIFFVISFIVKNAVAKPLKDVVSALGLFAKNDFTFSPPKKRNGQNR